MKTLYLITGPAGVGKSTISLELAHKLAKSALIEGDMLYGQVIGSYISPWKEGNHLNLMWQNAIELIKNYLENDYDVIFNYIIEPDKFNLIKETFKDYEIRFVVLMVDADTLIERDKKRDEDCQMGDRCLVLLDEFKKHNYDKKYILNTDDKNVLDCVYDILENNNYIV